MEHSQTEQDHKSSHAGSLPFSLWLSWQELTGRKVIFLINIVLIALLISLPVSLDLVGKARQSSVDSRIDYIGPSLIIVPGGILSSDLVTGELKGLSFSAAVFEDLRRDLMPYLRHAEVRLTERLTVQGRTMPVVGLDFPNAASYLFKGFSPGEGDVILGPVAAEKLEKEMGDSVVIANRTFTVRGIISTAGNIDDASLFLSLPVLQGLAGRDDSLNEIRLFPASVQSYEQLKSRLGGLARNLNLIDAYRGDTAEREVDSTLLDYQKALYAVAFILIALCIMISTYINLDSRKAEVSTVFTLGAKERVVFQVLTFRTVWITLLGSLAGYAIAFFVARVQDQSVPLRFLWSASSVIEVVAAAVCLGVLVTIPFAFYSVYKRDLIAHL